MNIGSVGGIEAREGYLAYGSSKAAFMWATRCISKELAPYISYRKVDVPTGIQGVQLKDAYIERAQAYDLTGRQVSTPTSKGLYIVNGKKVLVR